MERTSMRAGATLAGLLLVALSAGHVAGQADVAVEGLYGRADGPVSTEILGVGGRLGVPLGVSLAAELSRWLASSGADCPDSSPESLRCDVGGWLGLLGLRVGIPVAWPVQPYLGGMFGRSLGKWTPGFDDSPSSWGLELGLRLGFGPIEGSASFRHQSVEDLGYEATFGDTPSYESLLFRVGYVF
ncbi:MAG: hypothetical protein PVI57_15080 [Gemmatimonadota bacterium]